MIRHSAGCCSWDNQSPFPVHLLTNSFLTKSTPHISTMRLDPGTVDRANRENQSSPLLLLVSLRLPFHVLPGRSPILAGARNGSLWSTLICSKKIWVLRFYSPPFFICSLPNRHSLLWACLCSVFCILRLFSVTSTDSLFTPLTCIRLCGYLMLLFCMGGR